MQPKSSALSRSISKLGIELFQETSPLQNLVLSPLSILNVMVMLHEGAAGETRDEIASLFVGASESSLNRQLGDLLDELTQQRSLDPNRPRLSLDKGDVVLVFSPANSIWIQEDYSCMPAFIDMVGSDLMGEVRSIDMIGNPLSAAEEINSWVNQATNGLINTMISSDNLSQMSRLIACNALYFKATWTRSFRLTKPGKFHLLDGSPVQAQMMHAGGISKRYTVESDYWAVEVSYVNEEVVFIAIVPTEPGTDAFLAMEDQLPKTLRNLVFKDMGWFDSLTMPEFSVFSQLEILEYLRGIGVEKLFSRGADLSAVSENGPLWVDTIRHGASIRVDEYGTEATAVTMSTLVGALPPDKTLQFVVDRPFIFVILDKPTDTILFLGRVTDPRGDGTS